jgi:hypothetical protein
MYVKSVCLIVCAFNLYLGPVIQEVNLENNGLHVLSHILIHAVGNLQRNCPEDGLNDVHVEDVGGCEVPEKKDKGNGEILSFI